jgi:hypothetical protein
MTSNLLVCFALILGSVWHCNFAAAQVSAKPAPAPLFPAVSPVSNANPAIRIPFVVLVPSRLDVSFTTDTPSNSDSLTVSIDSGSLVATNLLVGSNMVTGVECKSYVYLEGESRPTNGGYELEGGTAFDSGARIWHAKTDGLPLPDKKYVVELELVLFETDVPPQHMWDPRAGKNYEILWQRTLKQTVSSTHTFLQNVLGKVRQQLPELAPLDITAGTTSRGEVLHGEEYTAGRFYLAKHPRPAPYGPPGTFYADLDATIHRSASAGDAQQDLERSLRLRQAPPQPQGDYRGASLYRSTSGGERVLCRSGRYVVEIGALSEGGGPYVMKMLDVILAELDSASAQPKQP